MSTLTIATARKDLDAKKYSALDLTDAYLDTIREKNPEIHAYLEVWEDSARAEAKHADGMIARGEIHPLTGIPLAIKDNILIEGRIASAASKILEQYRASYDATVTKKLKSQGAVFLGRTNMDEFAMGSSTENSAFGPSKNPIDTSRVPGGSSGGSSAAVAAHMALAALGSDTGGSIRQPASFTGLVGLKPTYGAVSRYGLMAMGSSLDQIGPLTRSVEDTKILFDAIKGNDPYDGTTLPDSPNMSKVRLLTNDMSAITPKRIGVPRSFLAEGTNPDILARFEEALAKLKKAGYEIIDIDLPNVPYSLAVYYIIMPAEVSTNLERFDGIRYGLSVPAEAIRDVYTKTRGAGFGAEARRRILLGAFVLSSGYADAYYRKARAVRSLIRQDFEKAFQSVDAIVTPTNPSPAFTFGSKSDPISMYVEDIFSTPANLAGVPAISVPMGTVVRDGTDLPVGLQIIAPHRREDILFTIGTDIERA
ncbi:Asp-tRNA(Asn)/Glu-tRNA(Gln) amidotransferase subunit GatA [Candidatus Kaiserbacteria bacterium]|nr:Asp-tRNA(Asn)/Glu-tRNA(Gln) amidotransferase subunit GatA [Candidatus Kaiserbacteria bacterium]